LVIRHTSRRRRIDHFEWRIDELASFAVRANQFRVANASGSVDYRSNKDVIESKGRSNFDVNAARV
jgi:hypothetical protein